MLTSGAAAAAAACTSTQCARQPGSLGDHTIGSSLRVGSWGIWKGLVEEKCAERGKNSLVLQIIIDQARNCLLRKHGILGTSQEMGDKGKI